MMRSKNCWFAIGIYLISVNFYCSIYNSNNFHQKIFDIGTVFHETRPVLELNFYFLFLKNRYFNVRILQQNIPKAINWLLDNLILVHFHLFHELILLVQNSFLFFMENNCVKKGNFFFKKNCLEIDLNDREKKNTVLKRMFQVAFTVHDQIFRAKIRVLFCFVFFHFILFFCFILFCFILICFILICFILICFALFFFCSRAVFFCAVFFHGAF
jgi:hypothetical protein